MRSTFRFLARRKSATTVAVLTIALAIGVNAVVFSVLKSFVISGMAIPDVGRLHFIQSVRALPGRGDVVFFDAYPNYEMIRDIAHASPATFGSVAVLSQSVSSWDAGGETRSLQVSRVSASFFGTMRVFPVMGAVFDEADEGLSPRPVALVSHALWQSALAGDAGAVGKAMTIGGVAHTIIGVMPPGFAQPAPTDVWLPLALTPATRSNVAGTRSLLVIARLSDSARKTTVDAVAAQFTQRTLDAHPADNKDYRYRVTPYRRALLDVGEAAVVFVQAGAVVLLLLAVLNLASLLVAWGFDRQQELAMRQALGASEARTVKLLVFQSALVVGAGAIIGAIGAYATLPWVRSLRLGPNLNYFITRVEIDAVVLLTGVVVAAVATLLASALPALLMRRANLSESLRSGSRTATLSPAALRWQKGMVFAQASLSVVVLSAAALIGVSFRNIMSVNLGFEPGSLQVARIQLGGAAYGTHESRAEFAQRLMDNLSRDPALAAVGFSSTIPVSDIRSGARFFTDDSDGATRENPSLLHFRRTSENYLELMGMPLLRGRTYTRADGEGGAPVAVVSKAVADRLWPGADVIGRRLYRVLPGAAAPVAHEVIGVVGNAIDAGHTGPVGEAVYVPYTQASSTQITVVADPRGAPRETMDALRRTLREMDASLAAHGVAPLATLVSEANALPRLETVLLIVLAAVAIGIIALGTYGVMGQIAAAREREFAIRLVFGAHPATFVRSIFASLGQLTIPGIAIGIGAVWLLGGVLDRFVFGIEPRSAPLLAAVSGVMLCIAVIATVSPAVRAMRVDIQRGVRG